MDFSVNKMDYYVINGVTSLESKASIRPFII